MTTPLWTRLAGASVGATLMACATPTYDRSTTLPVPASVVASATLNGMGYSALGYASESDFQSTTVSWVALREGREDRLLVRMITHFASGGSPPYGSGEVLFGLWDIHSRTELHYRWVGPAPAGAAFGGGKGGRGLPHCPCEGDVTGRAQAVAAVGGSPRSQQHRCRCARLAA
jgi:hypothetical protein